MTAGSHAVARVLALADGRVLCFRCFGRRGGYPVVALHGTPGSGLKFAAWDEVARQLEIELLAPDRWGYGGSTAPAVGRRTLACYAEDVAALADALGRDRFSLVGISGGAPFALAAGAVLAQRVDAVALPVPVAPISRARGVGLRHRVLFEGLGRIPVVQRLAFGGLKLGLSMRPRLAARMAFALAAPDDRRILRDETAARELAEVFGTGLVPGTRGPVIDMGLFARAWGFDLGRVAAPARIWLGTEDRNVSRGAARSLVRSLARCDLVERAGEGHLWPAANGGEILGWIAQMKSAGP